MASSPGTKCRAIKKSVAKHMLDLEQVEEIVESILNVDEMQEVAETLSNMDEMQIDIAEGNSQTVDINIVEDDLSEEMSVFDHIDSNGLDDSQDSNQSSESSGEDTSSDIEVHEPKEIVNDIADWAFEHNIQHTAINSLLKRLSKYHKLPTDSRTLLQTRTKQKLNIRIMNDGHGKNGEYLYSG